MTLRHLKFSQPFTRHSSITRAAEALHLAQPSVSLAVKELENYYGIRLFERLGRRITPTEGGTAFYGYAIHIVSLFAEMETRMRNWDAFAALRVGTSITIGVSLLPGLIQAYQNGYRASKSGQKCASPPKSSRCCCTTKLTLG